MKKGGDRQDNYYVSDFEERKPILGPVQSAEDVGDSNKVLQGVRRKQSPQRPTIHKPSYGVKKYRFEVLRMYTKLCKSQSQSSMYRLCQISYSLSIHLQKF